MFSPVVVLAAAALLSGVLASPVTLRSAKFGAACTTIDHRKEWRDLTVEQRLKYIDAIHCLHTLPPHDKTRAATSRYEEFQATHILLTERVHSVGHFLPWHRHLVTLYGKALREECGYDGPGTYWDWTRDADSTTEFLKSPIFDPVTGFGGDGVPGTYSLPPDPKNESHIFPDPVGFPPPSGGFPTLPPGSVPTPPVGTPPTFPPGGGFPTNPPGNPMAMMYRGCVQDGPFRQDKWTIHLGPGKMITDHCLVRGVGTMMLGMLSSATVQRVLNTKSYEEFRLTIDGFQAGIHGAGHAVIGGEMTNTYSAGADPLFYMHHAGLDKVWWEWQQADPENRVYDVTGPTTKGGSIPVTLDFELDFPALGPNMTVRDTMDSYLEPNCFSYA